MWGPGAAGGVAPSTIAQPKAPPAAPSFSPYNMRRGVLAGIRDQLPSAPVSLDDPPVRTVDDVMKEFGGVGAGHGLDLVWDSRNPGVDPLWRRLRPGGDGLGPGERLPLFEIPQPPQRGGKIAPKD